MLLWLTTVVDALLKVLEGVKLRLMAVGAAIIVEYVIHKQTFVL